MTASSHRIFNLSAAIALSFHWWVWLLFLLAASLPDQLEPATRERSRFRSHRRLFHTYSVWILLGVTIFWLPAAALTVSGIPVFNPGVSAGLDLSGRSAVSPPGRYRQSPRVVGARKTKWSGPGRKGSGSASGERSLYIRWGCHRRWFVCPASSLSRIVD